MEVPTDTKVVGHLRRNTDKFPTKSKKMKSSEFCQPFPTEFRRHTPFGIGQFRRNSDGLLYIRRNFVGKSSEVRKQFPINTTPPHSTHSHFILSSFSLVITIP
ncbi:hypothetical protein YC2023_113134 [Brassica napus]